MFVQVIRVKVNDAEEFARMQERWDQELRPGAKGWLGITSGVSADGNAVIAVRFEDEAAAKANSDRPEQGAFFAEASKNFAGEPSFVNSSDTDVIGSPSDDAGFVQVMTYDVNDRKKLEDLEAKVMPEMMASRPDISGSLRVWDGKTVIDFLYFSSEAEAREGEKKMGSDPEMQKQMEEFMALGTEPAFTDLPNPILRSA